MAREMLGIIITTYNRPQTAIPTIESLKQNLIYDEGRRFWVIADDGSPTGYVESLLELLEGETVYVTNAERRGVGHSKNLALHLAYEKTQVILLLEDDWVLRYPLDVRVYCDTLISNEKVGMIRLGYLSSDIISADLVGDLSGYGKMCYWRLKRDPSSMTYQYLASGQVSIRHKRFYAALGYHAEGLDAGKEEIDMCSRYNSFEGTPPEILFPANIACHYQCSAFITNGEGLSQNQIQPEVK